MVNDGFVHQKVFEGYQGKVGLGRSQIFRISTDIAGY